MGVQLGATKKGLIMRLYIPDLETVLVLGKPWKFKVINERRNASLVKVLGEKPVGENYYYPFGTITNPIDESGIYGNGRLRLPVDPGFMTLPAGTELKVDRIYIRKGAEDFSSVTFKSTYKGKQIRFFAKLNDVNKIEV